MADISDWRVESARSGVPTAYLNGKALHSRFDPVREAKKTAAAVPADTAIVVLGGLGLGYVAEALVDSAPERLLVICEADGKMLARAAELRNLDSLTKNPNVVILAGGDPGNVRNFLKGGPAGSRVHLMIWRPSEEADPDWYNELKSIVEQTSRRREVNAHTLERFGRLWVRNLAANTSIMTTALSLLPWKDSFSEVPALIIAGGPSLESVLPDLKALAERHLIISVDTAVSAVIRAGVRPDVVAAVDPQYWNTRHLDRCGAGTGNVLILAESATHPAVFRVLNGRPWLTRTRFPLGTILEDAGGIRGELKAGGSVATAAWDLARYLGCKSLTAAGLDLGFPDGRTHFSGSLSRERPHYFSRRTSPSESIFFHVLRDASPRYAESYDGSQILTDLRMDIYTAWFTESVASELSRSAAVLGGKGRKIPGMKVTDTAELLKRPVCRDKINGLLDRVHSTPVNLRSAEKIDRAVRNILEALEKLRMLGEQGMVLAVRTKRKMDRNEDSSELLRSMEELDGRLLSGSGREVISFLIQPIILELSSSSTGGNPLEASRRLYAEIAESAAFHLHYLNRAAKSG